MPENPWAEYADQTLEKESPKWYRHYELYRGMGYNRSIVGAYRLSMKEQGLPPLSDVPGAWNIYSQRYHWKDRAKAYDQREVDRRVAAERELQDQKLAEFREMIDAMKDKAYSALLNADYEGKEVKVGTITRLLEVLLPEYRNAYNISEAAQKTEVSGAKGESVEINVSFVESNPNE